MSERPRRSTRQPKTQYSAPEPPTRQRRKPATTTATAAAAGTAAPTTTTQTTTDPEQWLRHLLENPKSILTTIDISEVLFNAGVWNMLSDEARNDLKALLPPTAFVGHTPSLGQDHPASALKSAGEQSEAMDVDTPDFNKEQIKDVDAPSLFTDPHFLAASRTLQDHIYSNWRSTTHKDKVAKFETQLRNGTLAVPWKDEQWLEENTPATLPGPEEDQDGSIEALSATATITTNTTSSLGRTASWNLSLAGGATQIKLTTLVERGIIRVGDVLSYRRNFNVLNLTIEKDAIVESIDPSTHALTVLAVQGTSKALPHRLLGPNPSPDPTPVINDTNAIHTMAMITSPSMLESGLLDITGRVDKSQRPHGNAWKTFTVWRWRGSPPDNASTTDGHERGGRENHGTLFYLRGNYYHEEFRA